MYQVLIQTLVISSEWNSGVNAKESTEKHGCALLTLQGPVSQMMVISNCSFSSPQDVIILSWGFSWLGNSSATLTILWDKATTRIINSMQLENSSPNRWHRHKPYLSSLFMSTLSVLTQPDLATFSGWGACFSIGVTKGRAQKCSKNQWCSEWRSKAVFSGTGHLSQMKG